MPDQNTLFAARLPDTDERAAMDNQTRGDFVAGDVVMQPDSWGRVLFVVETTHVNHDGTLHGRIARRNRAGEVVADKDLMSISGHVHPSTVIRVCPDCLQPDPLKYHLLGCDDDDGPPPFDLDLIVTELRTLGITATVDQTGGGTATIYAGTPVYDPAERCKRYPVAAGPGHFEGPGWTRGRAHREEFTLGLNDHGVTDSYYPPDGATEADVARMLANVLQGTPPLIGQGETATVASYEPLPVQPQNPMDDPIAALYRAVADQQIDWLDDLLVRAGLMWCHDPNDGTCHGYMNRADEPCCGGCAQPRPGQHQT